MSGSVDKVESRVIVGSGARRARHTNADGVSGQGRSQHTTAREPARVSAPGTTDAETKKLGGQAMSHSGLLRVGQLGQIGRYKVLRLIGQGGMGSVFACYDETLDRKVAVKVLRMRSSRGRSMASARLEREGQALAKLSHPNVITVYEVGYMDDGLYIAMEFINGQTLDKWAEGRTWQEVLDAFIQAGRGLAAAHKVGIVHRDFKPQNIIVNGEGLVKVLDFGLARASGPEALEWLKSAEDHASGGKPVELMQPLTMTGALVGTPAYMSPEQFAGETATAASDQFSFCVALYQCIYKQTPFDTGSYDSLVKSVAAGRVAPAPLRSPVPTWVYRHLLRGLSGEPDERYASVEELVGMLDRRRSSRRAAAAASIVVALLTGATGFVVASQANEAIEICPDASSQLVGVWDEARAAEVASAVGAMESPQTAVLASVVPHLDAYAEDWRAMRNEACRTHAEGRQADALFDLRMACLDQRLAGLQTTGELLVSAEPGNLSKVAQAAFALPSLAPCADATALLAEVAPPEDKDMRIQVQQHREQLAGAQVRYDAGDVAGALEVVDQLAADKSAMAYLPLAAEVELHRGYMQMDSKDATIAERALEQAMFWGLESDHKAVAAQASSRLAFHRVNRVYQLDRVKADLPLIRVLNLRVQDDIDLYAEYLNNTGMIQLRMGDYLSAMRNFQDAVELRDAHRRNRTPEAFYTKMNMAVAAYSRGHFELAEEVTREVSGKAAQLFGASSLLTVDNRLRNAEYLVKLGRPNEAKKMLSDVMANEIVPEKKALGVEILAYCAQDGHNNLKARTYLDEAISLVPPSSDVAFYYRTLLITLAAAAGDETLMNGYIAEAEQILKNQPDPTGYRKAYFLFQQGLGYLELGRPQEALARLQELRDSMPPKELSPWFKPEVALTLGRALRATGDLVAAESALEESLVGFGSGWSILRAQTHHELGLVALDRGDVGVALKRLREAEGLFAETAEPDFTPYVRTKFALAKALAGSSDSMPQEAIDYAEQALKAFSDKDAARDAAAVSAWLATHR